MAKWTNQDRALCQYLIVIIFLSSRERFPIPIRRWCRNCIGACPLGLYLDGVPCFRFDLFGLQHHRDHDHNSPFSKLRKCSPIQIWDPGDSNYISEIGGLRLLIRHTYGLLFEFVLGIGAMVLPRSQTSLLLCFDVRLVVPIICCPTTQMARSLFAVFVKDATSTLVMFPSTVSDYIDRDRIDYMMDFWLSPFGLYWVELSMLHVDSVIYWRLGFVGFDHIGRLENVLATLRWVLLDMRGSGIGVKISTDVYGVKCTIGWAYTGATRLSYVMWNLNERMSKRHTYHIRVRWILKKEYIMSYNMIASKAYRKEASSISLFHLCHLQHMAHKSAYVKDCFCEVLYGLNTVVILFI